MSVQIKILSTLTFESEEDLVGYLEEAKRANPGFLNRILAEANHHRGLSVGHCPNATTGIEVKVDHPNGGCIDCKNTWGKTPTVQSFEQGSLC